MPTDTYPVPGLRIQRADELHDEDLVKCPTCGCAWLEQILIQRYHINHMVILGGRVPPVRDEGFFVLRCIKCGEVCEPNVQIGPQDNYRKSYDNFLDMMEKPVEDKK